MQGNLFAGNPYVRYLNVLACVLAFVGIAKADTFWAKAASSGGRFLKATQWYTDEACTQSTTISPSAGDGHMYVVLGSAKITSSYTAPDTPFVWGTDGSTVGTSKKGANFYTNGGIDLNFPDSTVYGLRIRANSTGLLALKGHWTFINCGQQFRFDAANVVDSITRGVNFAGTMVAESDVTIALSVEGWSETGSGHGDFKLTGDFSGFKGKFTTYATPEKNGNRTGTSELMLTSANAMGDPTSETTAAITLTDRWALTINPAVQQHATRGITLNLTGTQVAYLRAAVNTEWVLTTPIAGSTGTLAKIDDGRVTLDSSLAVTNIEARAGTLVIGANASFAPNTKLTIKSGAIVISRQGLVIPNVTVVTEDGGVFSYDFTSPYDGVTNTTLDMTALSAADWEAISKPVPIQLSQAITQPFSTTQTFAVAKFPKALAVTADQFSDVTPTTYGLPVTRFEVVSGETFDTLMLVATPVVYLEANSAIVDSKLILVDNVAVTNNETEYFIWSDRMAAHGGADYVVQNGSASYTGSGWHSRFDFPGDSLVFGTTGRFYTRARMNNFKHVTFPGGIEIYSLGCDWGETSHVFDGTIVVGGSISSPVNFVGTKSASETRTRNSAFDIRGRLEGAGRIRFAGAPNVPAYIRGDQSDYKGGATVSMVGSSSYDAALRIDCGEALGGPLAVNDYRALHIVSNYNGLVAMSNLTLGTANRGIEIAATDCFLGADEGVTFVLAEELRLNTARGFRKTGGGTLAFSTSAIKLGADGNTAGNGTNNRIMVEDGAIKTVGYHANSLAKMVLSVSEDACISVDAAPTDATVASFGVKLTSDDSISVLGDHLWLAVDFGAEPKVVENTEVHPVLTVKTAVADAIEGKVALRKNFHGIGLIQRTDSDGYATFSAVIKQSGCTVIFR